MMKNLKFTLVGVGKVGSAFLCELSDVGIKPLFIIDREFQNKVRFRKLFKLTKFDSSITQQYIDSSDFILISVQDKEIIPLLRQWRKEGLNFNGKVLMHTSGLLTSEIFEVIRVENTNCGSIHPVQTFNHICTRNESLLKVIYFGLEGGKNFLNFAKEIIKKLHSKFIILQRKDKILYHTACSIASNFVVTNLSIANMVLSKCVQFNSLKVLSPIISQTIKNVLKAGPEDSLTGPVARGDINTVKKQIKEIRKRLPELKSFFNELILQTAYIAERSHKISKDELQEFKSLLR